MTDKIREAQEYIDRLIGASDKSDIERGRIIGWQDCLNSWKQSLATRPDVNQELVEALEKLARLGNGSLYGNSEGNSIAQRALAKHKAGKSSGFTEEELVNKLYHIIREWIVCYPVHTGDDMIHSQAAAKAIVTALIQAGALRLKGE